MGRSMETQLQKNINIALEELNLSMRALSKKANIGPSGISDIMKSKAGDPRYGTLKNIAQTLNVSIETLCDATEEEFREALISEDFSIPALRSMPDKETMRLAIKRAREATRDLSVDDSLLDEIATEFCTFMWEKDVKEIPDLLSEYIVGQCIEKNNKKVL